MKAKKLGIAIIILAFFNGCIASGDTDRFKDDVGKGQAAGIDVTIDQGTFEVVADTIVSNVQKPNINIQMKSNADQPVTLVFKLHNMRKEGLPILSPALGTVKRGNENKTVIYSITLKPSELVSVALTSFPASDSYTFAAVGDIQFDKKAARKLSEAIAKRKDLDFFVMLGDLVMEGGSDEYEWAYEYAKRFPIPVYAILGNHDVGYGADGYKLFRRYFGKTNYNFVLNNDLFLILDAADQGVSREVFDYTAGTLSNGSYDNKWIFQHTPVFDRSGMRNNSFNTSYDAARYMNMLINNDVDIVFSGHVHTFQVFTVEGVRNIIAGMGGGVPEKMDGIENGYITVTRSPSGVSIKRIELGD